MSPPLYFTVPVPLYIMMVVYYHLLAPRFKTEKQRAYLLSTLSASVMSSISLPFFWMYMTRGFEGMYNAGQEGWIGILAEIGVVIFGVYLFGESRLEAGVTYADCIADVSICTE
jgi:hypothetical protein